jgi:hypothetical protein
MGIQVNAPNGGTAWSVGLGGAAVATTGGLLARHGLELRRLSSAVDTVDRTPTMHARALDVARRGIHFSAAGLATTGAGLLAAATGYVLLKQQGFPPLGAAD